MVKNLNRIKVVLAERRKTNRWLAAELGKDETTVSKWCTNKVQPSLETMVKIALVLKVDMNDLVRLEENDSEENVQR